MFVNRLEVSVLDYFCRIVLGYKALFVIKHEEFCDFSAFFAISIILLQIPRANFRKIILQTYKRSSRSTLNCHFSYKTHCVVDKGNSLKKLKLKELKICS